MAQELVSKTLACGGSFDQPWDVGQHEFPVTERNNAEMGYQCGEWIVRDLRRRRRHTSDQRALAGIRVADQCCISDELEFEVERPVVSVLALFREGRSPAVRRHKRGVAASSPTTLCNDQPLAGFHEIRNERPVFIFDECSERHREFEVLSVPTVAQVSPAMLAVAGIPVWFAVVPKK